MKGCCPRCTLIPLARPEMLPRAVHAIPALPWAALMPFTLNDSFDDFAREHRLSDCAGWFLSRAGLWSARASRSGFVPSTMFAEFSSDPDQAVRALLAAGAIRRVKAGVRITDSPCWTLVNAKDVHQDIEREQAEAEARREKWRADKQRQRDAEKASQRERIMAGVSGMSTETKVDVHPENPVNREKPQVKLGDVQVDIPRTSTKTAKKTASDYQDQNQSSGVNQSNARAREDMSPEVLAFVLAEISKKVEQPVSEAEALRATAVWDQRAEKSGKVVHDPVKFYGTCIKRERNLKGILAPPPDPLWLELGIAPEPMAGTHPYMPSGNPFVDQCMHPGCGLRKSNARHLNQKARTG